MRTSLAIPNDILDKFDATWQAEGFGSRSRAMREAMTEYVEQHHTLETAEGTITGVITFDYEYESVIEQIHDIQHEYQNTIISTNHTHQGNWCLETLFVKGNIEEIRQLVYELKNFDSVRQVQFMFI
jgi:CopG family nickel-responsive transcriptional regulator